MTIDNENKNLELTILMPCLNEAETLEVCIKKAQHFLYEYKVNGEILISDNGSTDGSQNIALKNGARVVNIPVRGYGAALIGGCYEAFGKYVIMGDADDSYDFLHLMPFLNKLREGYDLVMGNRFKGGIEKGAMPPLHQYLGNPVLSFIGRLFYPCNIGDFHCGLRGYNVKSIRALNLKTTGMEYASEMVVQSTLHNLKMTEVPTTLSKDGRIRPPYLRSWSDGWRHLKFLLIHSPNFLYLYPGSLLTMIGAICFTISVLLKSSEFINAFTALSSAFLLFGIQLLFFSKLAKIHAINTKYIPIENRNIILKNTDNQFIFRGGTVFFIGFVVLLFSQGVMKSFVPALILMSVGAQMVINGFFITILNQNG